ncbi:hypothetical protein L202_01051 [Cryptococcus amylolentus CBS 6039]|uniref:AB hydrolase-1 domain-containing protein n=1 Tax=Cryptococcus amylolentus CBS 6039 TaxID=1295533 RepID=A0A1E3I2B0_9TREE|nr:hypothetical protein L202_01051 [Cryptococcus amylolentus CBS 6039]ODN82773.1 hypothetical protein L202_01051 [Cryptococcus amylolentus CBS 6039]
MFGGPGVPVVAAVPDATSHSGFGTLNKVDYPTLGLGHPLPSEVKIQVGGLPVAVWGLEEVEGDGKRGVVVLVVARAKEDLSTPYLAQGILGQVALKGSKAKARNLIIVTLARNGSGPEKPVFGKSAQQLQVPSNATMDRSALKLTLNQYQYRRRQIALDEIEQLIAALPASLPGLIIEEWAATGISLGGFIAWKLIHDNPRVHIGIPIDGLPFESISKRLSSPGSPSITPDLQNVLLPFTDPAQGRKAYSGKKILGLFGKESTFAPFTHAEGDIRQIETWTENQDQGKEGEKGGILAWDVQENVGHTCTVQMVKQAAEWVWRYGMVDPTADEGAAAAEGVGSTGSTGEKKKRGSFLKKVFSR